MLAILHAIGMFVADLFKSRSRLEAENLFLRHQLAIALRRAPPRFRLRGGDRLSVIFQKSLPSLRRRILTTHHVFRDRRLGDLEAKHQKLAMDPGCAPQRVFPAYPPDQITQATINVQPPCPISGFPTPEDFDASAMPTQNGLRLHRLDRTSKARPEPGHPYEQRRDHCRAIENEMVRAAKRWQADGAETNSQLQAGSAT